MASTGGFQPQGYGTSPSSQSPAEGKKERNQTLRPVSIFQLKEATPNGEDGFVVDGTEIGQIDLIGVVRSVDEKTTKRTYLIEDHTGTMEVTHWMNEDDGDGETDAENDCREGMYARVIGHLKVFNDVRSINAFKIQPVRDYNEITTNMLDTLYQHLRCIKGPLDGPRPGAGNAGSAQAAGSFGGARPQTTGGGTETYGGSFQARDDNAGSGNPIQNSVLEAIKGSDSEAGISVDEIESALKGRNYGQDKIREAIDWLSNEGHVYSTIDDDHYKSTDG